MRKFLIPMLAFLMLVPSITAAATSTDVLPDSVDIFYQIDVSKLDILTEFISESLQNELNIDQAALAERVINDNTFELALDFNEKTDLTLVENLDTYISFQLAEADLNEILLGMDSEYTETTYKDKTIYFANDSYGVHLDNIFYLTTSNEIAQKLIDNHISGVATLAQDALYQRASEYFLESAFLNMYIKPGEVLNTVSSSDSVMFSDTLIGANDFTEEYMAALLSEAVSVAVTDNGFDLSVFVEGDLAALKELNMEMNKFEFTPKLYKKLSGTDLMLYSESTNLKEAVDNIMAVSTETSTYQAIYDGIGDMLSEFSGQNFQTDILDLLDSNYMMTIHDSGQIIPSFTMIFDASAHKTMANASVAVINEKIKNVMVEEEQLSGENFYSYGTTTLGVAQLPKHNINLKALMNDDSIIKTSDLRLNLTLGVTDDGMIILSTHPALEDIWSDDENSKGLLSNSGLTTSWEKPAEVVTQVMYFDTDVLNQYMAQMLTKVETPTEYSNVITGILKPWHNMFMIGGATENTTWVTGNINVDIAGLSAYEALFAEYDAFMQEQMEQTRKTFFSDKFCDVPSTVWFSEPVSALYYDGIIRGYDDGCFHPSNEITRAEFTKMVFNAAEKAGIAGSVAMSDADNYFNDVTSTDWFSYYVNQAAANNIVNGYEDGTFHPNATITRAEAVQVLYNASEMIQGDNTVVILPFKDISSDAWYSKAVMGLYNKALLSDNASFNPSRNINRAEAAKLIYQFIELHR